MLALVDRSRPTRLSAILRRSARLRAALRSRTRLSELLAEVGDGLTGRRRRIVGVFEPPLLQQRSDTPCPILTSSSCFNQGRSPTRLPRSAQWSACPAGPSDRGRGGRISRQACRSEDRYWL